MNKGMIVIVGLATAAVAAALVYRKANEVPPECQLTVVTSSGYAKLNLAELKGLLETIERPELSLTPGIEEQKTQLRSCIAKLEGGF